MTSEWLNSLSVESPTPVHAGRGATSVLDPTAEFGAPDEDDLERDYDEDDEEDWGDDEDWEWADDDEDWEEEDWGEEEEEDEWD